MVPIQANCVKSSVVTRIVPALPHRWDIQFPRVCHLSRVIFPFSDTLLSLSKLSLWACVLIYTPKVTLGIPGPRGAAGDEGPVLPVVAPRGRAPRRHSSSCPTPGTCPAHGKV